MDRVSPRRGDVWYADLDPTRGREQAGYRPVLIISVDEFNKGPAELVIIVPFTTRRRALASRVPVEPPEGGLAQTSFVRCEDVRSISKDRLSRRLGSVSPSTLAQVEDILGTLMGL